MTTHTRSAAPVTITATPVDGIIVWAKTGDDPYWPARVASVVDTDDADKTKPGCTRVVFFGEGEFADVPNKRIRDFRAFFSQHSNCTRNGFQEALAQAQKDEAEDKRKHQQRPSRNKVAPQMYVAEPAKGRLAAADRVVEESEVGSGDDREGDGEEEEGQQRHRPSRTRVVPCAYVAEPATGRLPVQMVEEEEDGGGKDEEEWTATEQNAPDADEEGGAARFFTRCAACTGISFTICRESRNHTAPDWNRGIKTGRYRWKGHYQKQRNPKSKYKGVQWQNNRGKWQARFNPDYKTEKNINLGGFKNEKHAALAHDHEARKHGKSGAQLNFPEEQPTEDYIDSFRCRQYRNYYSTGKKPGSQYRGVCLSDKKGPLFDTHPWSLQCNYREAENRTRQLGRFASEVEAALAFDMHCRGKMRPENEMNFPRYTAEQRKEREKGGGLGGVAAAAAGNTDAFISHHLYYGVFQNGARGGFMAISDDANVKAALGVACEGRAFSFSDEFASATDASWAYDEMCCTTSAALQPQVNHPDGPRAVLSSPRAAGGGSGSRGRLREAMSTTGGQKRKR
jgi:hypothetical protein